MTKPMYTAVISDIHLGHRKNKTKDMVTALNAAFPHTEDTAKLDLIVLAGDVFDRLITVPEVDTGEILIWINQLLSTCAKYNIVLRVLEGTPSHEWFQSTMFETVLKITGLPVNFAYAKTLSIEHIDSLGINVLYVPDEWDTSTDKTLDQVRELLRLKGLDQVDYAFMHGNFNYQLPAHMKKTPRHDEEAYLAIVKNYIFIGHIHVHTNYKRIIAQGSFGRISHGEEAPKGHARCVVTDESSQWYFVENKLARVYKTINCKDMSLENTLEYIWKKVKSLPALSCVRIKAQPDHVIFLNMNELITTYPLLIWSKVSTKEEVVIEVEETVAHDAININKQNIVSLIMERVTKTSSDNDLNKLGESLLLEVI